MSLPASDRPLAYVVGFYAVRGLAFLLLLALVAASIYLPSCLSEAP